MFDAVDTAASGLTAQRLRMDIISSNIANAETTRTAEGGPYRRQKPVFAPKRSERAPLKAKSHGYTGGVQVVGISRDSAPPRSIYRPEHPDADEEGYVEMPNVDTVTEMVDMISASRAYEANVTVIDSARNIFQHTLNIGR